MMADIPERYITSSHKGAEMDVPYSVPVLCVLDYSDEGARDGHVLTLNDSIKRTYQLPIATIQSPDSSPEKVIIGTINNLLGLKITEDQLEVINDRSVFLYLVVIKIDQFIAHGSFNLPENNVLEFIPLARVLEMENFDQEHKTLLAKYSALPYFVAD